MMWIPRRDWEIEVSEYYTSELGGRVRRGSRLNAVEEDTVDWIDHPTERGMLEKKVRHEGE